MDEKQFKSKMVQLIDLLYQEIISDRLHWEKLDKMKYRHILVSDNGTINEGYITVFKDKIIAVGNRSRTDDDDNGSNYFISFVDNEFKAFDSYFDYEILSPFDEPKLHLLFKAIRRQVNGIDEFLDELLH